MSLYWQDFHCPVGFFKKSMESSFLHYICFGEIGYLKIGMSRSETRLKMGDPKNWIGKPPDFGPVAITPEASERWFYYGGAVGIGFNGLEETAVSISIGVSPPKINNKMEPFLDWPIGPSSTMGQLVEFVAATSLSWNESPDDDKFGYCIIINDECYALSSSFKDGKLLPQHDREIEFINFITDRKKLPTL